jgi:hypothetical protein
MGRRKGWSGRKPTPVPRRDDKKLIEVKRELTLKCRHTFSYRYQPESR